MFEGLLSFKLLCFTFFYYIYVVLVLIFGNLIREKKLKWTSNMYVKKHKQQLTFYVSLWRRWRVSTNMYSFNSCFLGNY